jgi:CheY-like chemotaxis protein
VERRRASHVGMAPAWDSRWCTALCTIMAVRSQKVWWAKARASTFTCRWPLKLPPPQGRALPGEISQGSGESILCVDDEEPLVFLATRMLERLGYEVTGCTDPHKALELVRSDPGGFDAVVSDLSMPGMSGTDLTRELLQIRSGIPIVIASGYIRPQDSECMRRLGVTDLMLEPDPIEGLGQTLHSLFAKRSLHSR